jgi:hypothetical protein
MVPHSDPQMTVIQMKAKVEHFPVKELAMASMDRSWVKYALEFGKAQR